MPRLISLLLILASVATASAQTPAAQPAKHIKFGIQTGQQNVSYADVVAIWKQAEAGLFGWNIFFQPLAFLLFLTSAFAECNRLPFDLPECEQELIGGYHTEYNAMKLAMFFLGEYCHMITTSFMMVILFFGGWHFPWLAGADAHWSIKLIVFAAKVTIFILFYMLIRWTLPRFRFDQLMKLGWLYLFEIALVNILITAAIIAFIH